MVLVSKWGTPAWIDCISCVGAAYNCSCDVMWSKQNVVLLACASSLRKAAIDGIMRKALSVMNGWLGRPRTLFVELVPEKTRVSCLLCARHDSIRSLIWHSLKGPRITFSSNREMTSQLVLLASRTDCCENFWNPSSHRAFLYALRAFLSSQPMHCIEKVGNDEKKRFFFGRMCNQRFAPRSFCGTPW